MGLFEPKKPDRQSGAEYHIWYMYWNKFFNDKVFPDSHKELDKNQLKSYMSTVEYWREWEEYKSHKWNGP
jgi:hypothetical protein